MSTVTINGVLEIDEDRGVIYFHAGPNNAEDIAGTTRLRICSLPRPIPTMENAFIDITHMVGVSFTSIS